MDGGNEQRVAIKFCFKSGLSAPETLLLVQKANGNEALNGSDVFRWYSRFRDVRELVEYDVRGGRPKSTRTEVIIAAVGSLVKNDCRIASRIIIEFYKGVLDHLLKRFQRVLPAAFCSRDFFLLHDNTPAHKAASVSHFFTQNNVTTRYHPRTLQIYLRQTIFRSQVENDVKRTPLCGCC